MVVDLGRFFVSGNPENWWIVFNFYLILILGLNIKHRSLMVMAALIMTTPMFYLLSLNIVRQWIGAIFLIGMVLEILNKKKFSWVAAIYMLASVMSHNMNLLIILLYCGVMWCERQPRRVLLYFFLISMVLLFGYFIDLAVFDYSDWMEGQVINETPSVYKKLYYFVLALLPWFVGLAGKRQVNKDWVIVSAFFLLLPITDWMIERFLITTSLLSLVVNVHKFCCFRARSDGFWMIVLVVVNIVMCNLHSGVKVILVDL